MRCVWMIEQKYSEQASIARAALDAAAAMQESTRRCTTNTGIKATSKEVN